MYGKRRQRQTTAITSPPTTTTTVLPERHNNKRKESQSPDQKPPPKHRQHHKPEQQQHQKQQKVQLNSRDAKMPHRINNEHNTMETVATTMTSPTTTITTTETTDMNNNNNNNTTTNILIDTTRRNDTDDDDDNDNDNDNAYNDDNENDNPPMNRQQHHTTDIVQSTNRPSRNNNNVVDLNNDEEERAYKEYIKKWKESSYAIGLSYTSWKEEKAICCLPFRLFLFKYGCYDHWFCIDGEKKKQNLIRHYQQEQQNLLHQRRYHYSKNKPCIACTACLCKNTNFNRVGNMIILYETIPKSNNRTIDDGDDDDNHRPNRRRSRGNGTNNRDINNHDPIRPKIRLVMGPYWMVALFVTFPIMLILSVWTGMTKVPYSNVWIQLTWAFGTITMLISFFLVACTDPGIQYRHRTIPTRQQFRNHHIKNNNNNDDNNNQSTIAAALNASIDNIDTNNNNDEWIWNDQALSFRIKSAKYDPECAVIIDQLDHVCPWTGTAVGKNNMCTFRIFILSVCINIIYNLLLLAVLAMDKADGKV